MARLLGRRLCRPPGASAGDSQRSSCSPPIVPGILYRRASLSAGATVISPARLAKCGGRVGSGEARSFERIDVLGVEEFTLHRLGCRTRR
jgi:hypothetical protein